MIKFSIDLEGKNGGCIPMAALGEVLEGCVKTLNRLGNLRTMVEAFRVTYMSFGNHPGIVGPCIKIYFTKLIGKECSFELDYRFIGKATTAPSSEEIADALCLPNRLPRLIKNHLEQCRAAAEKAQATIHKVLDK